MSRKRRFLQPNNACEALAEFVHQFIEPSARSRWRHVLYERPEKARDELHKIDRALIPSRCTEIPRNEDRDAILLRRLGNATGLYFDGRKPAQELALAEVLADLTPWQDDGIFCLKTATLAVVFHHDGQVWICTSRPR